MSDKKADSLSDKILLGAVGSLSGIGAVEAFLSLATGEKPTVSKVISAAGMLDLDGADADPCAKKK